MGRWPAVTIVLLVLAVTAGLAVAVLAVMLWRLRRRYRARGVDLGAHGSAPIRMATMKAGAHDAPADGAAILSRLAVTGPDIVYCFRLVPTPGFEYVNAAATTVTGYAREAFCGDPEFGLRISHPADRHLFEAYMRGQTLFGKPALMRWLHKDGRTIWTEQVCLPVRAPDGTMIAIEGVARDVTAREERREQRKRTWRDLMAESRLDAVGRLAGGLAHNYNNLLMSILGYAELMLDRLDAADPGRALVARIQTAGLRAADLTHKLLAYARQLPLQPREIDVNIFLTQTATLLGARLGKAITLDLRLAPGLGRVRVDPDQLGHVLVHLAMNARDAMPDGGRLLLETSAIDLAEPYVRMHRDIQPGRWIRLAVSDTGLGMDEATRARLFEPFAAGKSDAPGAGLGLAMAYGFVRQSGGYIHAYSELGKGSCFKLYFPAVASAAAAAPPPPEPVVEDRGGTETVLIVEDDGTSRRFAAMLLQIAGYTVLSAFDGVEALDLAAKHAGPIHLLFTDFMMPRMGGKELADRLAAARPGLKVLYTSAYTREAVFASGDAGGVHFIEKPFTAPDLRRAIRRALAD